MVATNKIIPVSTRIYQYRQMVERADPKRKTRLDPGYEFSNGRRFKTPRDPYISAK